MSAIPSTRLTTTLTAAALLAVLGTAEPSARAADPTASECDAATQQSIKLRVARKLRQARDQAQICVAASCSSAVRATCKKYVTYLTAAIPTVEFFATDELGHDMFDVKVSMDGEPLVDHLEGAAIPVDPGEHTFTFEVAGQPPVNHSFLIVQGKKNRREVMTLLASPPHGPPPVAVGPARPEAMPGADSGGTSPSPWKTVAFTTGGVGVASLLVGGIAGGVALSKWNASQSECASPTQCQNHSQSVQDHDSALSLATVSTVTFVIGGAALAGATLLLLLSPSRSAEAATAPATSLRVIPSVGPGLAVRGGTMTVGGVF